MSAKKLLRDLQRLYPTERLLTSAAHLQSYESDALTMFRARAAAVVLPNTAAEVVETVRLCNLHAVPFVARGSGTSLSGGSLPVADGIVIALGRLDRILRIDARQRIAVVEPGVRNLDVSLAAAPHGLYYAPDPSSQQVCSIGGNVAENSGGAHCLKHGFTVNHVTGLEFVLPDGELVELGGKGLDPEGLDLLGVIVGSEGTLGIATRVTLRILKRPEAVLTLLAGFATTDAAGRAVSEVIAAGILPSAIEMMDSLTIEAAEAAVQANYPAGVGAVLIVELDGVASQVEEDRARIEEICRGCGAGEIRAAADEADRARLWRGRKAAFAAMGRVSPSYYVQDGVVPRTKLPLILRRIADLEAEYGLRVGNVFHAGDGNLHPLVCYDHRVPGELERAREVAEKILLACVEAGGSITGEHGVGVDKACSMPLLFGERDLDAMNRVRRAFDPAGLANPGKVLPTPRLCGEVPGPYRAHPIELAGLGERL